ncbi:MAG: serine hydrolase domain-containing protein, partial [Bacteroidota bacterium]
LYQQAYGIANLEEAIPIGPETVFDIASVSKQFTAACIFLLEQQGKLSLEAPIQTYLPEIPRYPGQEIKVRHLLYHTSGLREYLRLLYIKGLSWNLPFTHADGLALLSEQKGLNFDPGSRFSYSNTGYMLLASIVERVSGQTFAKFAQYHLFDPLGMHKTFVRDQPDEMTRHQAIGYSPQGDSFVVAHYDQATVVGEGGVHTTVEDIFKWSENFKHQRVGGKDLQAAMLRLGYLDTGQETEYAGGLFLGDYRSLPGLPTIGHDGSWAGFRSLFFKFPEQDLTFVILSNNANTNVWALLNQMVPLFLENELVAARSRLLPESNSEPPEGQTFAVNVQELFAYVGPYFNPVEGYTRRISLQNDTLVYTRSNGMETKLIPVAPQTFAFLGMPFVQLRFQKQGDDTVLY